MIGQELSCTLSGQELVARIQEWRKVAIRAEARQLQENTVVSVYPNDPALVAELNRLIAAEKECCSFMEFRVEERPEQVLVRLEVPHEMRHLLALMVGLATDEREPSIETA